MSAIGRMVLLRFNGRFREGRLVGMRPLILIYMGPKASRKKKPTEYRRVN